MWLYIEPNENVNTVTAKMDVGESIEPRIDRIVHEFDVEQISSV